MKIDDLHVVPQEAGEHPQNSEGNRPVPGDGNLQIREFLPGPGHRRFVNRFQLRFNPDPSPRFTFPDQHLYRKAEHPFADRDLFLDDLVLRFDRINTRYFDHIELTQEKDRRAYTRLIELYCLDPAKTWMVGNSPRSDINPALQAGLHAILIPHPRTWELEHDQVREEGRERFRELKRFEDQGGDIFEQNQSLRYIERFVGSALFQGKHRFSGTAGAYAHAKEEVAKSLAGVAIAVAAGLHWRGRAARRRSAMTFIPQALLRNLYNRSSLRNTGAGVRFSVKNRLSPATLERIP